MKKIKYALAVSLLLSAAFSPIASADTAAEAVVVADLDQAAPWAQASIQQAKEWG
ncbi:MAG TPA: hypothetical protein VFV52_08330 [Bacilli bacterium]|nr:hypothetical protein [Bacilli bacterium]